MDGVGLSDLDFQAKLSVAQKCCSYPDNGICFRGRFTWDYCCSGHSVTPFDIVEQPMTGGQREAGSEFDRLLLEVIHGSHDRIPQLAWGSMQAVWSDRVIILLERELRPLAFLVLQDTAQSISALMQEKLHQSFELGLG